MDRTIRNLDGCAYREIKARAALEGKTVGEAVSEAIRSYLRSTPPVRRDRTLADIVAEPYPPGNERLSEEIAAVVYGASS